MPTNKEMTEAAEQVLIEQLAMRQSSSTIRLALCDLHLRFRYIESKPALYCVSLIEFEPSRADTWQEPWATCNFVVETGADGRVATRVCEDIAQFVIDAQNSRIKYQGTFKTGGKK